MDARYAARQKTYASNSKLRRKGQRTNPIPLLQSEEECYPEYGTAAYYTWRTRLRTHPDRYIVELFQRRNRERMTLQEICDGLFNDLGVTRMIRYIRKTSGRKAFTTPLFRSATGREARLELLWGDRVRVISSNGSRWKVKARGATGFVDPSRLQTGSLLELYFIDVGQGDGVLIRTPDDKHILIDGGWPRRSQPTGKNAADFVDWKFVKDYERDNIHIDTMETSMHGI